MLTKERSRIDNLTSSLSPESWAALKLASIGGTSDRDLSEVYEVTEDAIRKKRSRDKVWAVSVGLRNQALGKVGLKSKHLKELIPDTQRHKEAENAALGAIAATFADESQAARLLALQIGTKGLKSSLDSEGGLKPHLAPMEPAHVKVYAEIAAKAGQWGGDNQVTINCQAYAGSVIAPLSNESEDNIVDI